MEKSKNVSRETLFHCSPSDSLLDSFSSLSCLTFTNMKYAAEMTQTVITKGKYFLKSRINRYGENIITTIATTASIFTKKTLKPAGRFVSSSVIILFLFALLYFFLLHTILTEIQLKRNKKIFFLFLLLTSTNILIMIMHVLKLE